MSTMERVCQVKTNSLAIESNNSMFYTYRFARKIQSGRIDTLQESVRDHGSGYADATIKNYSTQMA